MADTPKPPPNLRVADDESHECDTCKYDERGKCTLYSNLPVDDEWVCDDWVKGSTPDRDSDTPVADQPRTLREASVRVRSHFRRARQKASPQQ
jgi:hypothetical protein